MATELKEQLIKYLEMISKIPGLPVEANQDAINAIAKVKKYPIPHANESNSDAADKIRNAIYSFPIKYYLSDAVIEELDKNLPDYFVQKPEPIKPSTTTKR